jgi:hypothetical protein
MKWIISSVALTAAVVLSVGVAAQSGGAPAKGHKMEMDVKDTTYTGCIEAGAWNTFTLTHLEANEHKGKDMKKKDTMAKDGTGHTAMAPTTLRLTATSVDLSAHVGQKVSVTGPPVHGQDTADFAVKSMKMVAPSCS